MPVALRESRSCPSPKPRPLAPHQSHSADDAAHALERGGVVSGQSGVQAGARVAERDPARGVVQLAVTKRCSCGAVLVRVAAFG